MWPSSSAVIPHSLFVNIYTNQIEIAGAKKIVPETETLEHAYSVVSIKVRNVLHLRLSDEKIGPDKHTHTKIPTLKTQEHKHLVHSNGHLKTLKLEKLEGVFGRRKKFRSVQVGWVTRDDSLWGGGVDG